MDVVVWLRSLGLEEYEAAFRDNNADTVSAPAKICAKMYHGQSAPLSLSRPRIEDNGFIMKDTNDQARLLRGRARPSCGGKPADP